MLIGCLEKERHRSSQRVNLKYEKPWFNWRAIPYKKNGGNRKVAIIGSGIAGCTTAYLLAQRDFQCHLFEARQNITSDASAAACGIYHPSITSDFNFNSQFNWLAFHKLNDFIKTNKDHSTLPLFFRLRG
ncbi:MAG: FAD-dependent oxidoreductase [Enterobacterales bacterium]|nr:FAD-dependent oxidoreductase [Enterobacterales bacterium]